MIDDDLFARKTAKKLSHWAELDPGARVENHDHVSVGQIRGPHRLVDDGDLLFRIDERQIWWSRLPVDDADGLTERAQNGRHAQLAAQCVAIGPDVARQHEPLIGCDDFSEAGPVDRHESDGTTRGVKSLKGVKGANVSRVRGYELVCVVVVTLLLLIPHICF